MLFKKIPSSHIKDKPNDQDLYLISCVKNHSPRNELVHRLRIYYKQEQVFYGFEFDDFAVIPINEDMRSHWYSLDKEIFSDPIYFLYNINHTGVGENVLKLRKNKCNAIGLVLSFCSNDMELLQNYETISLFVDGLRISYDDQISTSSINSDLFYRSIASEDSNMSLSSLSSKISSCTNMRDMNNHIVMFSQLDDTEEPEEELLDINWVLGLIMEQLTTMKHYKFYANSTFSDEEIEEMMKNNAIVRDFIAPVADMVADIIAEYAVPKQQDKH